MIVAYADESGNHDPTGQHPGSAVATVGGYVGLKDEWDRFSLQWQVVLAKYKVCGFHFKEWAGAHKASKGTDYVSKRGDYNGWKARRLFDFVADLGEIVYDHRVFPFGGWVDADKVYNAKVAGGVPIGIDPYDGCLASCFGQVSDIILRLWPQEERANVVFDDMGKGPWMDKVNQQYYAAKARGSRLGTISFSDDKGAAGAGLQAADLISGHIRLECLRQREGKIQKQQVWETRICKGFRFDLPSGISGRCLP